MWDQRVLSGVRSPGELFQTDSYLAAVPVLLGKRDYENAMWAARLGVALEQAGPGERLTDQVLHAYETGGTGQAA